MAVSQLWTVQMLQGDVAGVGLSWDEALVLGSSGQGSKRALRLQAAAAL